MALKKVTNYNYLCGAYDTLSATVLFNFSWCGLVATNITSTSSGGRVLALTSLMQIVAQEKRVAFIGISNWALDPAKMNRGIMVMRGEPSIDELVSSARYGRLIY